MDEDLWNDHDGTRDLTGAQARGGRVLRRQYLQNIQYIADNVLLQRDPPDVQCVRCE